MQNVKPSSNGLKTVHLPADGARTFPCSQTRGHALRVFLRLWHAVRTSASARIHPVKAVCNCIKLLTWLNTIWQVLLHSA